MVIVYCSGSAKNTFVVEVCCTTHQYVRTESLVRVAFVGMHVFALRDPRGLCVSMFFVHPNTHSSEWPLGYRDFGRVSFFLANGVTCPSSLSSKHNSYIYCNNKRFLIP